jgi:hypothetical protein
VHVCTFDNIYSIVIGGVIKATRLWVGYGRGDSIRFVDHIVKMKLVMRDRGAVRERRRCHLVGCAKEVFERGCVHHVALGRGGDGGGGELVQSERAGSFPFVVYPVVVGVWV